MRLLAGYQKPIAALAVTPDGSRLYSAARGQAMIWEWDLAAGTVLQKLRNSSSGRAVEALAMSPRGDFLAPAGSYYEVWVWPADGGRPPRQLNASGIYTSPTPALAIHPTRRLVAAPYFSRGYGYQTWDLDAE